MTARKLVYYGMVVSPSLMLGFIGLGARAYIETYDFAHFDADQDSCARYYIGLVQAANKLPIVVNTPDETIAARKTSKLWCKAVLSGEAKTIPTLDLDQSSSWTVCEEVSSARTRLSWLMWKVAQKEIEKRHYDQASKDLIESYVVSQATKGMNLFTISQSNKRQSMVLERLVALSPYMSAKARREVSESISKVRSLDRDSHEKMKIVRAEIKCAATYVSSAPLGDSENLGYWKRMYQNADRTTKSLNAAWSTFNRDFSTAAFRSGPMPSYLVYAYNPKPRPIDEHPRYADRMMPYMMSGPRMPNYGIAVAMINR